MCSILTLATNLISVCMRFLPPLFIPPFLPGLSRPRRWAGAATLIVICVLPLQTLAQEMGKEETIFRRFQLSRKVPKTVQKLFEIPVALRPQSDSDAEIKKNFGINYVTSGRPDNRWYISSSVGISKMEWEPSDPNVDLVKLRTFDWSFLVNRLYSGWLVASFGLGLGIMDGFVQFSETGQFSERLEPFIPIHFGLAARLGGTLQVGLKLSHFPFFRQTPAIATTRLLVGIGFSY